MKFLNNIDLQKNEIQNFRVQNLAAAPEKPVEGQHYYNTVDHTEYVYDGSKWINALSQGDYTFENGVKEEGRHVSLTAATASNIGGVTIGDNIDVLDGKISVKSGDKAQAGLLGLATDEEAAAGAEDTKAVTAKQVNAKIAEDIKNKIELTSLSAEGPITYNNLTGAIAATYDATATAMSENLMKSKDIKAELDKKVNVEDGKSLVLDTDITQITTNKDDIADLKANKADKTELPKNISDLNDDTDTTPIKKATDLDGLTTTKAELNELKDAGAVNADFVKLHGITATAEELNYTAGVTSGIQAQLDDKVAKNVDITGGQHTKITYDAKGLVTAGEDLAESDIPELHLTKVTDVTATAAEVNFLGGAKSNIQEQLDSKLAAVDVPEKISDLTDDTDVTPIARAVADKNGDAIDTTYVKAATVGAKNGVASLDDNGLVPAAQLPSFVDDVVDLIAVNEKPATCKIGDKCYFEGKIYTAIGENAWNEGATPEADKIYVDTKNSMSYRWSGTTLVQIGADKLKGFNGTIVGDDATTTFTIEHNLGTRNVVFEIYEAAAPYEKVYVQVLHTSLTALQVVFSQAPAVGTDYNVTVIAIA